MSGPELSSGEVDNLMDGLVETSWMAPFDRKKEFPSVLETFDQPFILERYDLVSSPDELDGDPAEWTLQGSINGQNWSVIDTQRGVEFSSRNERKVIYVTNNKPFSLYRMEFRGIRKESPHVMTFLYAVFQNIMQGNNIEQTSSIVPLQQASPTIQLAELSFYRKTNTQQAGPEASHSVSIGVIIGVVLAVSISILIAIGIICRRRKRRSAPMTDYIIMDVN